MNKYIIAIAIIIISLFNMYCLDELFGLFNYEGSRLKKIVRWEGNKKKIDSDIIYEYNKDGYLIGRRYYQYRDKKNKRPIYETSIEYDGNKVKETFNLYRFGIMRLKVFYEYNYDDKKRMIGYTRSSYNKNKELKVITSITFKYNNFDDIIYVYKDSDIWFYDLFMPNISALFNVDTIFDYEYNPNIKYIYGIYTHAGKVKEITYEYRENRIVRFVKYGLSEKEITKDTNIYYDNKGNVIKTIGKSFDFKDVYQTLYYYDDKSRIIKRERFYSKRMDEEYKKFSYNDTEEYYYEDGNYVYYPYLLPETKINIYYPATLEVYIDKAVF